MKKLTFQKLDHIDELAYPEFYTNINLDSSALKVLTDFKVSKPLTIENSISAVDAEKMMIKAHVKLKLILDENNHFLGIVSLDDLNKQKMIQKLSSGEKIEELILLDFLTPRDKLFAIEYSELAEATINDVIFALQENGEQHCLVVEPDKHRIRGIISASDIARVLHIPINIEKGANFIKIFNSI